MKPSLIARRFLIPSLFISVVAFIKYRALISPRAEVEISPLLKLGRNVEVGSFTKIKATAGRLSIGANTAVASGCFIGSGTEGTEIGSDCLVGPNCTIVSSSYRYEKLDMPFWQQGHQSKGTKIGNNVLLGSGTVVIDGAEIGDDVMIGANSVVSGRIPANTVAGGNPARVLFNRRA